MVYCYGMFKRHDRNLGDTYKTGRGDTMHLGSVNPKRSDIPSFPISHKLIGQKARVKMEDEREGKSPTHPQKTKEDIMHYIGIDISKDSFTYSIVNHRGKIVKQETVPFTRKSLQNFISLLKSLKPVCIGIESTGPYHHLLSVNLRKHGFKPRIINPLLIKNFHKATSLRKTKTDKIDSKIIADFMRSHGRELPDTTTPKLKPIAREREKLARENARLQNQIRQELHSLFPEIQNINLKSKRILTFLSHFPSAGKIRRRIFKTRGAKPCITIEEIISLADKSIGIDDPVKEKLLTILIHRLLSVREEMENLSSLLEEIIQKKCAEKLQIFCSIPGINKTLAIYFICETEGKNFKTWKNLIAYAGIDPSVTQSGKYEGKSRISKRGNPHLRRTLYLMSMSCILQNPTLKAYYLKKREHLAPKQAIIATASKLARIIYTLLQKKCYFQPSPP
ncbi:IS110 family transposase [bacterium]|nr:MAG: IS110 family transposase [bacterium]